MIGIHCLAIAFVGVATQFVLVSLFAYKGETVEEVGQSTSARIGDTLGEQKFGTTLMLTGPAKFQAAAARVAADARMNVDFEDDTLQ